MNQGATINDMRSSLAYRNVVSYTSQEKLINRLQVNGSLVAMVSDVLDSLMHDQEVLMGMMDVKYKHEKKMHKTGMEKAYKDFHYHMKFFTENFFGDKKIQSDLEDNSQDYYDIIKLIADHTNSHSDLETIKRNLRKRKLNHHIFE